MSKPHHQVNRDRQINFTVALCLAWILVILAAVSAFSHDPGLSAVEMTLGEKQIAAQITFARDEIATLIHMDADRDGQVTQAEFDAARTQLEVLAREALILIIDGKEIAPNGVSAVLGDSNALHFKLNFPAFSNGQLTIRTPIIARLARGHRQFLTIRDEAGKTVSEKLLDANTSSFEVDKTALFSSREGPQSFWKFLKLGVEHIMMGFDHLAFLIALLLVGGTLREAAKIITSFTLAHSITLALATLNLINISPHIVEPMIAVSIIYVGIENIFRKNINQRWLLTFAFGLIHGFGFASVLRDLGIGAGGNVITPLFSFNLGVEIGQLAIAAPLLPLIWKLNRKPSFILRYAPACSILVALAGGYWLIERTMLR